MDPFNPFESSFISTMNDDGTIMLKNVRLSYPKLFKPEAMKGPNGLPQGAPKFGAVFICNFSKEKVAEMGTIIKEMVRRSLGNNVTLGADKYFFRNGDNSGKPENAGFWLVNSSESETNPPTVLTANGQRALSERDVYAGCMVDAVVRPWAQDNGWGKRINAGLVAVKFVAPNTPFGAPVVDIASKFGLPAGSVQAPAPAPSSAPAAEADPFDYPEASPTQGADDFNPFA